jgi:hypothetical protein
VGLLPITLFGVFVLVTTLPLLRVMKGWHLRVHDRADAA